MNSNTEAARILEAVLFLADEPVPTPDLAVLLEMPGADVEAVLTQMSSDWEQQKRGVVLRYVAGGWRMTTDPQVGPYLERFVTDQRTSRLSHPALETLAIIAYRQPISRGQLAEIRGVNCDRALRTLLIRGVIEEAGRDEGPGRAILYRTTPAFLERVGLGDIGQLPALRDFMPDSQAVERMETGLGPRI